MADSQMVLSLIDYFKKLLRVLLNDTDFQFFGHKFIKKAKIDDILCCILATMPKSYKNLLNDRRGKRLSSILAYNLLFNAIKRKFILNSNVYMVNFDNVKKYIDTIIRDIEHDIDYIEKNFS